MQKRGWWILLVLLLIGNIFVWWALQIQSERVLKVTFLDVGQGDAILIESPAGRQVLIDGGPDRSVLRQLPKVIGPFDRTLDLVVATHSDRDHIGGLIDIFDRYRVDTYIESSAQGKTTYANALHKRAETEKGLTTIVAKRGMRIDLGGDAYADILYPDRNVTGIETNTGSVTLRVVYGETEFLLSGDAPAAVEEWLVMLDGESLQSDVLKAGHHGSRTSTSDALLDVVRPKYVVVSAGQNNSYGHPHAEVIARIQENGARFLTTMNGSVRFLSNGTEINVR